ncbi:hypothetical protein JCM19239_2566 [Vibrio variabilis]|uniref:Uncharacterized protein n=1 Tax=Vibrio variabilis TaxID=990271 RepID=A0ABQ0JR32_9VIBR|nr:hypothetical protein JCM19239_2566 [Vibrio variabilis]
MVENPRETKKLETVKSCYINDYGVEMKYSQSVVHAFVERYTNQSDLCK